MNTGSVGILNVGAGDIELRFDSQNVSESIRAGRIVKDMLRRGYALLVEVERDGQKSYERATDFDEAKSCYIIADLDPVQAAAADEQEEQDENSHGESQPIEVAPSKTGTSPSRRKKRELPASSTKAVAVGRSAGG